MSFLRERRARYYFLFLCGIALVLLLFSILMTWQHTRQVQELLLEREATLASSLLEQGVSTEVIAAAMKSESVNTNGLTFMAQIGHTSATPLPLSPLARQTAISFGIFACFPAWVRCACRLCHVSASAGCAVSNCYPHSE